MSCLTIILRDVITNVTPQTFKYIKFSGAQILSGDKYYIDKAVSLGAIKPKAKRKAKK
jgi:hypothetical protein